MWQMWGQPALTPMHLTLSRRRPSRHLVCVLELVLPSEATCRHQLQQPGLVPVHVDGGWMDHPTLQGRVEAAAARPMSSSWAHL